MTETEIRYQVEFLNGLRRNAPAPMEEGKFEQVLTTEVLLNRKWLKGEIKSRAILETMFAKAFADANGVSPLGAEYFAYRIETGKAVDRREMTVEDAKARVAAKLVELCVRVFAATRQR